MTHSNAARTPPPRLSTRKSPSQARAAQTVATILEGAADILDRTGLEGYTTNAIAAHAGVSIGSLYQYFPTKDAITVALIERETAGMAQEAIAALVVPDRHAALQQLVEVAVRYQLRRPKLARLLDFEQERLATMLPRSENALSVHAALTDFLAAWPSLAPAARPQAATDIMAIISALTDAAGRRHAMRVDRLADAINGAVKGYLGS